MNSEEVGQTLECTSCNIVYPQQIVVVLSGQQTYCEECLEQKLAHEQNQIKLIQEQYIFYKEFESSLDESEEIVANRDRATSMLHEQKQEAETLAEQLKVLQKNIVKAKYDCDDLKTKIKSMELQQQKFWEQMNKFDKRAIKLQEKALSAKFDKQNAKNQIQKIGKTCIIHSFVNIDIDDSLGYVWGMAMGKKSQNADIVWDDINSGLGHLFMALNFLSLKYQYEYKYFSQLKLKGALTEVQLSKKAQFSPLGYNGRDQQKIFGEVMDSFLLQTLGLSLFIQEKQRLEYSEETRLPFKIYEQTFKIGEYYLNPDRITDKNKWTHWTKACRVFLINFKHILTIYSLFDNYL